MEKYTRTIPAGASARLEVEGNYIYIEECSDTIFLNAPGGKTYELKEKRTYRLKEPLKIFELQNQTAGAVSIEMHIGIDEIIDNTVKLVGTVIVNNEIEVKNTVGGILKVDDDATQTLLGTVITGLASVITAITIFSTDLLAELRHATNKRKGLTPLTGQSYAGLTTATSSVVVASGTNVNGIHLAHASIALGNNAVTGVRTGAGNYIIASKWAGNYGNTRDIFIPAGVSLEIVCGGTDSRVDIFYKVL